MMDKSYLAKNFCIVVVVVLFAFIGLAINVSGRQDEIGMIELALPSNSNTYVSSMVTQKLVGDRIALAAMSTSEKVKVIISLREPESINEWNNHIRYMSQNDISTLKKDMRNAVMRKVEITKHTYTSFNGFSAEISLQELEELIATNLVERIEYDYPVQTFMQDTVGIINASSAWNLQVKGINLTGKGQTVCVIDSGVDYTHPDLGSGWGNKVIGGFRSLNDETDQQECNISNPSPCYDDHYETSSKHSHGTHVAGIVAANGSTKGVVPNANIVAVKALNTVGGGILSDIAAGIEWCTINSFFYNISIISLSLGTPGYHNNTFCDKEQDLKSISLIINNSIKNNISVVISTGNENHPNKISAPACIQNAIRVGSSIKADNNISSFSNRWALDMLVAPGNSINSTIRLDVGYHDIKSGTSMAAPHVAGAIAIINQYLQSVNKTKTPKQIEEVLNSTGKPIYDGESGRYYSRIDVYSALLELDDINPVVNISLNVTNLIYEKESINILWSAFDDLKLQFVNFNITYPNGTILFESINQSGYIVLSPDNLTEIGMYNISLLAEDTSGNNALASSLFNVEVRPLNLTIISPIDNYIYNYSKILLNISVNKTNLDSIWFRWNITDNVTYENPVNITFPDGWHILHVWANNSLGEYDYINITFFVDTIAPNITINSPKFLNYTFSNILLNITVNDSNLDAIWFNWNGTNFTYENTINITFPDGEHVLHAWANDTAGNINTTNVTFLVDTTPPYYTFIKISLPLVYNETNNYWFNITLEDSSGVANASLFLKNSTQINYTEYFMLNQSNLWYINFTALPVENYSYYFWANDTLGNAGNMTAVSRFRIIDGLNISQAKLNNSNYTIPENRTSIIVETTNILQNITIPKNKSDSVKLTFTNTPDNSIIFTQNIKLKRATADQELIVEILENTKMKVNAEWDGSFTLPELANPNIANSNVHLAIKVGSEHEITFNKAVKIILQGQANKTAGWIKGSNELIEINLVCDGNATPQNIDAINDTICKRNNVDDLEIWTYHFTTFAAYTEKPSSTTGNGGGGGGGGGGGASTLSTCTSRWVCTEWGECINGFESRTCEDANNCNPPSSFKPEERERCFVASVLPETEEEEIIEEPEEIIESEQVYQESEEQLEPEPRGWIRFAIIMLFSISIIVSVIIKKRHK